MTCDRCPLSLVCLSDKYVIHTCHRCDARILKPRGYWPMRKLWYTVRCQGEADPEDERVFYVDCPRCHPCDYEAGYGFSHLHVARDGSILTKTHAWWCKRQAWWLYRDLDEPKPPYPQEVPSGQQLHPLQRSARTVHE